ncbi:hypothetical protein [Terriglobus sp. TAA 43]|uniref:hypothetical protein n=1 Tax=Terriglobus sp. TAA 43 TaxID=278961 RepID=UPI0012EE843F|nr:hypothetical protein [Terriglobus sp. TAA 43]
MPGLSPRILVRRATVAMFLSAAYATSLNAQALPSSSGELDAPRVQIYTGYSYWHPIDASINNVPFPDVKFGAIGSATYFLRPWLGVTAQFGSHVDDAHGPEGNMDLGLQFQTSAHRFTPFVHVLGGSTFLGGPANNGRKYGWNATAGVGLDWVPTYHHDWLAVRLFQGDYEYNHVDFGPSSADGLSGGIAKNNTLNASTGLVFRFGGHHRLDMQPQMSCSANRVDGIAGDRVTVNSQILGFDVLKPMQYTWHTTGGMILGGGSDNAIIDTAGLPAGDYRVTGLVTQGRRAAQCSAAFSARQPQPPTVSCIASPTSVAPGGNATVTATGISPDNRPLVYAFNSTSGRLNVNGNTATITAPVSRDVNTVTSSNTTITVTCNARDDHGQMASAAVTIPVTLRETYTTDPNLAPLPLQSDMCSVSFERDRRRPARVDNEGKACLDGVALSLQRQQDATLVILGDHTSRESVAMAAERAVNVKLYLTREKGIDASRIKVRVKDGGIAQVQNVYLSVGSTFNEEGRAINERAVVHHSESYGRTGAPATTHPRRRTTTRKPKAATQNTDTSVAPASSDQTFQPPAGQVAQPNDPSS